MRRPPPPQNYLKGVTPRNNHPPMPVSVSLVPITDIQGFAAQLAIKNVTTNRAPVDCVCRPSRGQNCTCVPGERRPPLVHANN